MPGTLADTQGSGDPCVTFSKLHLLGGKNCWSSFVGTPESTKDKSLERLECILKDCGNFNTTKQTRGRTAHAADSRREAPTQICLQIHVSPTVQKTLKHYVCTHMDRHVEVIGFERVCHFPESTEGIVPGRLLKAKRFLWLTALLPEKDKDKTFLIYS